MATFQRQPSGGVLKIRCSEKMQQIYRGTLKYDLNIIYWNHTLVWVFSCKFAWSFQSTFSEAPFLFRYYLKASKYISFLKQSRYAEKTSEFSFTSSQTLRCDSLRKIFLRKQKVNLRGKKQSMDLKSSCSFNNNSPNLNSW